MKQNELLGNSNYSLADGDAVFPFGVTNNAARESRSLATASTGSPAMVVPDSYATSGTAWTSRRIAGASLRPLDPDGGQALRFDGV